MHMAKGAEAVRLMGSIFIPLLVFTIRGCKEEFNHFTVDTITRPHTAVPFHLIQGSGPLIHQTIRRLTTRSRKFSQLRGKGSVLCDYEIREDGGYDRVVSERCDYFKQNRSKNTINDETCKLSFSYVRWKSVATSFLFDGVVSVRQYIALSCIIFNFIDIIHSLGVIHDTGNGSCSSRKCAYWPDYWF